MGDVNIGPQSSTAGNVVSSWPSYTPSWTNLTVSNATNSGNYTQVGKLVTVQGRLVWGSTTSSTASQTIMSLPVTAVGSRYSASANEWLGVGSAYHVGSGGIYPCMIAYVSTTTVGFIIITTTAGANPVFNQIFSNPVNSTSPFAWASTDILTYNLTYEAA